MKSIFLTAAALVVAATGLVNAADMPVKAAAPAGQVVRCAASQWQGAYIGIHGGSAYHDARRNDTDGFLTDNAGWATSKWGGHAGGQIGYNWTQCSTVWGVEIDGSWAFGTSRLMPDDLNGAGGVEGFTTRVTGFGTARLRTGFAFDNTLIYITGGFAAGRFHTDWRDGTDALDFSNWRWGWTAGLGSEWAIGNNWSIKGELLYVGFTDYDTGGIAGGTNYTFKNSDNLWVSRIGLNYRFGGGR
jgi:outer membrane immunogenic protein